MKKIIFLIKYFVAFIMLGALLFTDFVSIKKKLLFVFNTCVSYSVKFLKFEKKQKL